MRGGGRECETFLGYCTNVHSEANAREILQMLRRECAQVKKGIHPEMNFGVGLWLSAGCLREFQKPGLREELKDVCRESGLQIFSWNAFPYLDFHQETVKELVYQPHWAETARLDYTLELMDLISAVDLGGQEVSISTLPLAGKCAQLGDPALKRAVENLMEVVIRAVEMEERSGLSIHLNLEPEPFCFLETSQDVVRFYQEYLLPVGGAKLREKWGGSVSKVEQLILDKIRVCYDTCHAAVLFETPEEVMRNYNRVGIQVGKVQISSALVYRPDFHKISGYALLKELARDRYLHQVVGKGVTPGSSDSSPLSSPLEFHADLKDALLAWEKNSPDLNEYRIHYHIPVFMDQLDRLGTTQNHILELLELSKTRRITRHWEVETYTWSVIPQAFRDRALSESIAREVNWVYRASQPSRLFQKQERLI